MNTSFNGKFIRGSQELETQYCVSTYVDGEKFDELPKSMESPFCCNDQQEALDFVKQIMCESPDTFTYVIRKLKVLHIQQ